jgi:cytochrome c oxidase accessory protein FixG
MSNSKSLSPWTQEEAFRDTIGTLDESGKRKWIYPLSTRGRFTRARNVVAAVLLALFFAGPWVRIDGYPLLMLNVVERRFVILGQPFWPQDFHLFVLGFLLSVVFIALLTMIFGRVFCGWVCPQTVFMEHVFRRIERWIEGDAPQRRTLDKRPWDFEKLWKKSLKHSVFFAVAFVVGNWFLMYVIGTEEWIALVTDPPARHLGALAAMTAFSGAFYFVFAFLREQVCIVACPYGRLQGVLLDPNSVVITYDYKRGEPRGKVGKADGDCIDCGLCVRVCPTGIDIRNGTQLECINCTACMDACDSIMDKVGRPRGLIRYSSLNHIARGLKLAYTGRMKFYTFVLTALAAVLVTLLVTRSEVETTFLRTPGMTYKILDDGRILNVYKYDLVNKTHRDLHLRFKLVNAEGGELTLNNDKDTVGVPAGKLVQGMALITFSPEAIRGRNTPIEVGVYDGDERVDRVKTNFNGPVR